MRIDSRNVVSIKEATRNFPNVTRMVDESGMAVIFKNNAPRYVITAYCEYEHVQMGQDKDVMRIVGRLIDKHRRAFEELNK